MTSYRRRRLLFPLALAVGGTALPLPASAGSVGSTAMASVDAAGGSANAASYSPATSGDGRFVAFDSDASDLVAFDTNATSDVFVRDIVGGTTTRISVQSGGVQANGPSLAPAISSDGRYVTFESNASNLVLGDTNGRADVFVHDRVTTQTSRVSVGTAGGQANDDSREAAISGDGRFVAFRSWASNLVAVDGGRKSDVFVHDLATAQTTMVSVDSAGVQGNDFSAAPALSADGRYVAFHSWSSNLAAGDSGRKLDVFVHDRLVGHTAIVSTAPGGMAGNDESFDPSIAADGSRVAFASDASDLVDGDTNTARDIFVRDLVTGVTSRASTLPNGHQVNGGSELPSLTADGRRVAFQSAASAYDPLDTNGLRDIYVKDLEEGDVVRSSARGLSASANGSSEAASISADGRYVAFSSTASNLVTGDTNGARDVFLRHHSRPPSVPALVLPEADGEFGIDEQQVFTVNAVDPEGDAYRGVVRVQNALTMDIVATFSTSTVPSGFDASGSPEDALLPGEYVWSAFAVDVFGASSEWSTQRRLRVAPTPANHPPAVPALVRPQPGEQFVFGEPFRFWVNATDPDNDPYRAFVVVRDTTDDVVATFETLLVPSGHDSTGHPSEPIAPGAYTWTARAVDARGRSSAFAPPQSFQVEQVGTLLVL